MQNILIKNATIITQNNLRKVVKQGYLYANGESISYIGTSPPPISHNTDTIDAKGAIITPGLINSHVHLGETIFSDHIPLPMPVERYIEETNMILKKYPEIETERNTVASFSALEYLRAGITTISGGRTARAAERLGIRNISGYMLMESPKLGHFSDSFPSAFQQLAQENASNLTEYSVFIHSVERISEELLDKIAALLNGSSHITLQVHIAETATSLNLCKQRWGDTPISVLASKNLLGLRTTLIHCNHLSDIDFDSIATTKSSIAHCLSSNLSVADSTLNIRKAISRDINVTIASDGVASGGKFDLLDETGCAYRYHNRTASKDIIPHAFFFDAITRNAAYALGLQNKIGSLEVGKIADFVVWRTSDVENIENPVRDMIEHPETFHPELVVRGGTILYSPQKQDAARTKLHNVIEKRYRSLQKRIRSTAKY